MFFTYLRRELAGRRRQTAIVALGMALAIALVMIVNSVAAGVRDAQSSVLESVYGVGTDITVAATPVAPGEGGEGGGPRFEFGADDGSTADGATTLSQSRLSAGFGTPVFDAAALETVESVENVAEAAATLSLTNTTFSGEIPDRSQMMQPGSGEGPQGADGAGGSAFGVESFTVLGLNPATSAVGPLSSVTLEDGRGLDADDAGANVAVLDSAYAASAEIAVGDTITIADAEFEVVGTVASASAEATTASNVYIPLDVAQTLSGETDMISSIAVQAASSTDIEQVQADIEAALPEATVSSQDDLASSVSGSLSTASSLVSNLGTWLSIAVLAAAFLIAILFTVAGVSRRTREFGTLKAIGWSNRRIVGQVAGESVVQGLIGGAVGIVVGVIGVTLVNVFAPTLTAQAATTTNAGPGRGGGPGFGGAAAETAATTTDVALSATLTPEVITLAVALAVLGGLLAGAIGGWRAARLRPAEALRSVA